MARVVMYQLALRNTSLAEAIRLVGEVLEETKAAAKALTAPGSGPYTSGALSASIDSEGPFVAGRIVTGSVGSKLPYADIAHNGSPIHEIYPKGMAHVYRFGSKKPKQLKFLWRGRTVYTPHVPMSAGKIGSSHPGYEGKKYLTTPLRRIARVKGFRYVPGTL